VALIEKLANLLAMLGYIKEIKQNNKYKLAFFYLVMLNILSFLAYAKQWIVI
jgi:hypothetical protein